MSLSKENLVLTVFVSLLGGAVGMAAPLSLSGDVTPAPDQSTLLAGLWQVGNSLYVGQRETGQLDMADGGRVASSYGVAGWQAGSHATIDITDAGSRWDVDRSLIVAGAGQADVTLNEGGRLVSGRAVVGQIEGAVGTITVTGAGSLMAATGYGDKSLILGDAGSGSLLVQDGAVVVSGQGIMANSLTGQGQAVLRGTGSRWSNHAGDLLMGVSGGQARLDVGAGASVDAEAVMIGSQSVLQGAGHLTARQGVTQYGTIMPGNGIGTLTIDGDLTVMPGSVLEIEIDNQGQSDCLQVTEDVAITGGTFQAVSTETITGSHVYTVVQADRIEGQFDTLDTALLQTEQIEMAPALDYADQAIHLRVASRSFADADLTTTPNQKAVGSALQTIADAGGNTLTTRLQQVASDEQLRSAYDQLTGQSQLSVAPVTTMTADRYQAAVSGRLAQTRNDTVRVLAQGGLDSEEEFAMGLWGKGYGQFGDRETQSNAAGYGYEVGGGALGWDTAVSAHGRVGVTGGFAEGDIDYTNQASTNFEGATFGLYGSFERDTWYLDGMLTWAGLDYDTQRTVNLGTPEYLTGQFKGQEFSGYVEIGCDWLHRGDWRLQPLAGLRMAQVNLDGYTETGGPSALRYDDQRYNSVRGSLGAKLTCKLFASDHVGIGTLQLRARWNHEFGDSCSAVDTSFASNPGAVFTVIDESLPRDSGTLGLGFYVQTTESTQLRFDYDTRFSQRDQTHLLTVQLEVLF